MGTMYFAGEIPAINRKMGVIMIPLPNEGVGTHEHLRKYFRKFKMYNKMEKLTPNLQSPPHDLKKGDVVIVPYSGGRKGSLLWIEIQ